MFDLRGVIFIVSVPLALMGIIIGSQRWKISIYLFLIWFMVEGALRKWVFPQYSSHIFLFKYIILICPIFHFIINRAIIKKRDYPFYSIILIYLIWGFLEVLNPRITTDLRVKILGIMVHYAFIPLIYFVPLMLNRTDKILRLFQIVAILSIPIFILGIIQYYSPIDSPLNKYIGEDNIIALAGGKPRITSVFTYITTYGSYLSMVTLIIFLVVIVGHMNKITYIVVYFSCMLAVINVFMTGSRGVVYFVIISLSILIFLLLFFGLLKKRKQMIALLFTAILSISAISYTDYGKQALESFLYRAKSSGGEKERIIQGIFPIEHISKAGLFGYGIGIGYQGSGRFLNFSDSSIGYFEAEYEKAVMEMGLIGMLIIIVLKISIFVFSINTYKKTKDRREKIILLFLIIYQIPIIMGLQPSIYNVVSGVIYWFCIGIIISINRNIRPHVSKNFSIQSV
jgi:hypothetical protein